MSRPKNPLSQINVTIGSATHWMFRGLISFLSEKLDIELPAWLERNIAYYVTGLFLVFIGIWHYLPWLPSIRFPSFDFTAIVTVVAAIAAAISAYYAWQSAEISRKTLEYYQKPTIIVGHQNGVYLIIRNIGPGIAKSITCSGNENINIIAGDNPLPLLIPFQGPAGARENYGVEYLMGLRSFGFLNDATEAEIVIHYKNLLDDKAFISRFRIARQGTHGYEVEPIEIG